MITAAVLSKMLAQRHSDAVFIPECKMGMAGSRTLDGWALLPTWSPLTTIGYETKVSRSDWLQDQKFEEYRAVCHLFFVVAPKRIVERQELPAGVGLLEPVGQGDGARLVMRVKAVRQEPDPAKLVRLMAYALMWKRVEHDPGRQTRPHRAEMWRRWVADRQEFQAIGGSVAGRMRQILTDAISARRAAEAKAERLADAARVLEELGVQPQWSAYATRREIERALSQEKDGTLAAIRQAATALAEIERRIGHVAAVVNGSEP